MNELINEFKENIEVDKVFSHLNFEIVKEEIISSKSNIIFLLGDPGSGKSFLLNYLYKKFDNYILFDMPFLSIDNVLKKVGVIRLEDVKNKKFLIDEAQLLDEEVLEFFRILSDRGNQVIFAMHKKEGENIIKKKQFLSRYVEKIVIKEFSYEEYEKYIRSIFITYNKEFLIDKKYLKKIYKITKGNFRLVKKFYFNALILLDYSFRNHLKYRKIDDCIFTMTAIKLGLK